VLRTARRDPRTLAIGIDADAASMRAAAGRAARARGGQPNAVFVVAAVEALPPELAAVADEVTVLFPWGSLLRGVVTGAPATFRAIADLLRPGGAMTAMWSIVPRDVTRLRVTPLAAPRSARPSRRTGWRSPARDGEPRRDRRHGLDVGQAARCRSRARGHRAPCAPPLTSEGPLGGRPAARGSVISRTPGSPRAGPRGAARRPVTGPRRERRPRRRPSRAVARRVPTRRRGRAARRTRRRPPAGAARR